nr:MAG TPA: hypothetical protein [Caudoviricetes sp.]
MANTDKLVYLPQFQRYDEKIKGWADGKFLLKTDAYSLPAASTTKLGGVKIGTGLNVATDGTASVNETYVDGRVTAVGDKKYALKADVPGMTPMASATEAGKVYAVEKAAADTAKGTVKYSEETGLVLTDIAVQAIAQINLKKDLSDTIDNASQDASIAKQLAIQNEDALKNVYMKSQTYTKTEVDNKVSAALTSAIVPKGTVAYASLPTPAKANLGYMYNVSDAFTTDERFVEGASKKYEAGTNVYVVAVTTGSFTEYKFDVFMGFVDLSGYQTKADMPGAATDEDIDAMFA